MTDIHENIINYLSYQDAEIPEETKIWNRNNISESAQKYGESLTDLFNTYGQKVHEVVQILHDEFTVLIQVLDYERYISPFGKSLSWVYWDMAKQYYFVQNPHLQKDSSLYPIRNPMNDNEVQREIVLRHLGWEVYRNRKEETVSSKFKDYERVVHYLQMPPTNANDQLTSANYYGLGLEILSFLLENRRKEYNSKNQPLPRELLVELNGTEMLKMILELRSFKLT